MILSTELIHKYSTIKKSIEKRLEEFAAIPKDKYFYELCFCFCTPQSKASSALIVQKELEKLDFRNNDFDPVDILYKKENYIRFHRQKSNRLIDMKLKFSEVESILNSNLDNYTKRNWLAENLKGIGYKEASHFMRNIGYRNLAILDRHILKHLVSSSLYHEIPNISTKQRYLDVEQRFLEFANYINIPIDHLDLLFWSEEAGEILK